MSDNTELLDIDDKRRLEFTLQTRETLIQTLVKEGLPDSEEKMSMLTSLLDGMDRTILGKARVKAADKANDNNEQYVAMVGELLKNMSFGGSVDSNGKPPELDDCIVNKVETVPGEKDIGVQHLSYDEFFKDDDTH